MKLITCTVFALSTLCTFAACDGGSGEGEGEGVTTFDCLRDDVVCDSAKGELCLFERFANGEGHTPQCLPADDCTDCDCAEEVARAEFDGVNNCDGGFACSVENGAITAICQNVGL